MPAFLALLLFTAFVLAGLSAFGLAQRSQDRRQEIRDRLQRVTHRSDRAVGVQLLRDERLSNIPLLNTILMRTPTVLPLVRMIRQAGLRRRVGEVLLYIPLMFTIGIFFVMLFGLPLWLGVAAGLILAVIPLLVVSQIRRRRLRDFQEQLPESLDLIRAALQAGHGLIPSMAVATETLPDPISTEFRYVIEETRLGLTIREALYHLSERVGDPNIPILIVGVLVAQEVGGNLAEVIDNTAYTIRERAKLHREIRTLTAQARYSALVLTALPIFVGVVMYTFNPTYFDIMTEQRTGQWLLCYAVLLLLGGHFFIRRILNKGMAV